MQGELAKDLSIGTGYICCGDQLVPLSGQPAQWPSQDSTHCIMFYCLNHTYGVADWRLGLQQSSGWRMAMMSFDPSCCSQL